MSIPSGWYFCAESKDIKPGQVLGKKLFGENWAIWRSESGKLSISHAVCPHLGSDLSKLGKVNGEDLQCFSHDYRYNGDGDCTGTGFKAMPCRTENVLRHLPVQEKGGFVLAWFDANGKQPDWSIPAEIFERSDSASRLVRSNFEFKVPIEILNEDNFDVGHLYKWHNVTDVVTEPVTVDGKVISIAHDFKRHSILFQKPLPKPFNFFSREITSRYSSTLYGPGLTFSFIDVFNLGVHMQDIIWCTPIDEETTMYTTFLRRRIPSGERTLLKKFVDKFIQPMIFVFSYHRLRSEHKYEGEGFWENQSHVENPILTEKERALIEPYRQWCNQFNPDISPVTLTASNEVISNNSQKVERVA